MISVLRRAPAWALMLALLFSCLCFSLPVAALDESMPTEDADGNVAPTVAEPARFMSELFFGSDGNTYRVTDDCVVLPVKSGGQGIRYSTVTTPAVYDVPNNAVRFVLTNYSSATYFHVKYTYDTGLGPRTETTRVDILPYSERCSYPVRIASADSLLNMTLILPDCEGTALTLHAMEAIHIWDGGAEERGTITSCTYHKASKTVTVKGSVFHDVMIAAGGGTLGLFRLSPEQTVQDIIHDPTAKPVVTSSLSIGFQLQTTAPDLVSRFARYTVLICMPDGTRLPLGHAAYAVSSQTTSEQMTARSDFKGIDTTLISGAIDSNVGSAIVDVYLNRLENDRQSGYLYAVENEYFYFNRAYLAELDAVIRSLSGSACKVYLRFLVEANAVPLACATAPAETSARAIPYRYRALRANDSESLRYLYAYTSFLCGRYQGGSQGKIAGIILGTRVDQADEYNAAGELTLSEYVSIYGQTLSVISLAAKDIDPTLAMIVPVSDGWNADMIGHTHRYGDYTTELFAESLAAYLSAHRAAPFSLMIESTHNPYGLNNTYFTPVNTDGEEGPIPEELLPKLIPADRNSDYLSSENIVLLDTYLQQHTKAHSALSDRYFFHWTPDEETGGNALSASYIYHYYRLFSDAHASAFFVSFRERELGGDMSEFSKIKYLVKYIDTSLGTMRTEFALDIFEADSWQALIPDFDRARTEQMTLLEGMFTEYTAENVVGSYSLFDFSVANSTRGWYAGNGCQSLSVGVSEQYGKTLDAVMSAASSSLAEYSDIAYHFDVPLMMQYSPYMSMTFAVDCANDTDAVFEIKLVIGSDEGYMEAKQVVKNGEQVTVSLNTTHFANISKIDYIRLSGKTVMGEDETFTIHLSRLQLDSREYEGDFLKALIEESQRGGSGLLGMNIVHRARQRLVLFLAGAVLLCTVVVSLMLTHYQRNNPESEEEQEE